VKRILAYSSVAHSGYMLLALLAGPVIGGGPLRDGMAAMLFYMVVYGVMNLGAFAVLALVRVNNKPAEELDDLAGLWQTQPLVALAMAICIFSLMGMPPTAGFLGKVYVFSAALSAGASHPHATALIVLTVIGVLNAAVAAAYYLRIVGACYFREPETPVRPNIAPASGALQIGLLACCIVVLILGLWPKQLMQMSRYPTHDLTAAAPIVSVQADEPNGPE
jgi:NADH-quinone oxidoreductase subunit N